MLATEPLPVIAQALCRGCQRCVDVCPTAALGQRAAKAYLRYPDRCTYCRACEEICPTGAISLPFQIVLSKREEAHTLCTNTVAEESQVGSVDTMKPNKPRERRR